LPGLGALLTISPNLAHSSFFSEFHRGQKFMASKIAILRDSNQNLLKIILFKSYSELSQGVAAAASGGGPS
jgi:hypothetical protein